MTVNEYLAATYAPKEIGNRLYQKPRPAIKCADGFHISVQAGEHLYCRPRETFVGPFSAVECGFPSGPVPTLAEWKDSSDEDDTQTVYGYVPVHIVDTLLDAHGGIVYSPAKENA